MTILLAIDDSKFSEAAIQAVAAQAPRDTKVWVLHVLEPPSTLLGREMGGRVPEFEALWKARREHAEALVAKAAERLHNSGLNATPILKEGDPKSKIIDLATQWHAELIVVGSHGRKGIDRFLMGSVAESVVRHAPCSVEIARMPKHMEKLKAINTPAGFEKSEFEPGCYVADSELGTYAVDSIIVRAESLGFQPSACNCESCRRYGPWSECEFRNKVEDEANDYLNKHFEIPGHSWGRNKNADWGLWPIKEEETETSSDLSRKEQVNNRNQ